VNRIVVAVDASSLAVIKGILELSDNVHEDIEVRRSLFDDLLFSVHSVLREVGISVLEAGLVSGEGSSHPVVGIRIRTFRASQIEMIDVSVVMETYHMM